MFKAPNLSTIGIRLTIMLVMLGIAAAIVAVGGAQGRLPEGDWYELSRQRILQADLTYRLALYLDLVLPNKSLPALGGARQLKERAMAEYEREALVGRPNPVALHRLGILYGERGYREQAREALVRAATLDESHAGLYFSLAAIYAPSQDIRPLGPQGMKRVRNEDRWLAGLVLPTYYERINEPEAAAEARRWAESVTRSFGNRLLLLLSVYGGLGLIGFAILAIAIIRWAFFIAERRPTVPPLVVPWEPLDALEVVALLYFAMVTTGVVAGTVLLRASGAPDWAKVLIVAAQYLLVTFGVLFVAWSRITAAGRRKLSILGMRFRKVGWQVAQGVGGYAVLVVVLVLLTVLMPGSNVLKAWQQAGERVMSMAQTLPARVLLFVLICVLAPVLEEVIFRGFVYPGLRRRLAVTGAVVASALLFAMMHNNPAALLPIGLIGIVLAVLYERSRSLVPPIVCHALNNTLVFFLMLLTS